MFCAHCGRRTEETTCGGCGEDPRLDGVWSLLEVIGRGGMGVTWRGEGPDGPVAIKEIAIGASPDPKAVQLAHREAQVLEELRHPGVPTFIGEVEQGEGKARALYLVQELIEGTDLAQAARMNEDEVLDALDGVLDILEYLHGLSPPVVHRDLKPANIRRRPDGSLVLVDFGSVRDALSDLGGDTVAGTFGYMAPEQFAGDAGPRSDLFGLGATAIALLTRVDPATLQGPDRRIRWRHLANESGPVGDVIDRLVAVRPEDRPPSAAEARQLLAQARQDRDRPPGVPVVAKVGGLTVLGAVLGVNLVVLMGLGLGIAWVQPWHLWDPPGAVPVREPVPAAPVRPVPPRPEAPVVRPEPTPSPAPAPARPAPHGRPGRVLVVWKGKKGAKLSIDGEPAGTLPAHTQLKAGVHTFTVHDGPIEMSTEIEVRLTGETTRIDLGEHW